MSYKPELKKITIMSAIYLDDAAYSSLRKPTSLLAVYVVQEGDTSQFINTSGIDSLLIQKPFFSYVQSIATTGIAAGGFGSGTKVRDLRQAVNLSGFGLPPPLLKSPLIYNLKQYAPLQGKNQSSYGTAYLQGGVRWVNARAIAPPTINTPVVINTTANQYAYPSGITSKLVMPAPTVTPHTIWVSGIAQGGVGYPVVIPTPVLRQKGVNHFEAGNATVWFHTRPLTVTGFESYDTGNPKVFDPTQFIQPSMFNRTAVFGDTSAKNVWTFASNAGAIDSAALSPWAVVENRDRSYLAKGFLSQSFGQQSIRNKSPSIFFNGLPAPIFYNQAIGYRIRAVAPTGFNHLGLGKPDVIKTPELLPNGLVATQFGTQWVSNYTREVKHSSINQSRVGEPTVWFRVRFANAKSWLSQEVGLSTTVTHGVREVITNGFIQQAYGIAWVSRGIRLLEPTSIYKDNPSNHYVGRHQEIKPVGYIATLFGTRIIPESMMLYPQGFIGTFGLTTAFLQTQYLQPRGYQTSGEQQAYRWGRQIVYNSDQYIVQNFDGDNGLVPPKWSDWQSIENRNKTIRTIGTAMQKFGYAQIDNHARLLEPQGLIATKFSSNMIAYRIRKLPLQGIEAPYMAGWHVIHNDARVIKPSGEVQSLFGNADIVKTRRYFDRIGRIESFESGTPMIAYRIRTLEVEKRYSIAPPIIRLPTVDLHTRYVEFNGYETAKYGLASLSIHFRIITPRWSHREKVGNPALHNVTPELLTRGHDSQEYGQASVRTQWRHVYAQGDDSSAIGLLKISDTKQHIAVRGFIDSLASQKHTVTQGESAPYSLQYVYLNDEGSTGKSYGIKPPEIASPGLNQNVIYPNSILSFKSGVAFLYSNTIVIESGIAINGVGTGGIVRNANNTIAVSGIEPTFKVSEEVRLSPHTIWAVKEAPAQAIRNHKATGLHRVGEIDGGKGSVRYGTPKVESTIRSIFPSTVPTINRSAFGNPKADLRLRIIETTGFRRSRFGIPKIPFTPQDIVIREGIDASVFGLSELSRPPYTGPQYINMQSIYSTVFGSTYSDNFVRTLTALGKDSLSMGMSKPSDTPFMWQGLRVGEHVPLVIGGDDMSRHGLTWISLRVRELGAEGFNAFRSEYELSNFKEHMTVKNADKKLPVKLTIQPAAIAASSNIGYQDIKFGQHYIRPDGNSDQFRKGGYHA